MEAKNNLVSITKSASTTEQLNNVIEDVIEDLEEQGYEVSDTSTTASLLKSITIKKKSDQWGDEYNISFNYIFTKDVNAVKEDL